MATIPWFYDSADAADAWDTCGLGVFILPGLAKVDVERSPQLDVKVVPGQEGARVTNMGNPPAKITINLVTWTAEQWAAYPSIVGALEVFNPKAPRTSSRQQPQIPGRVPQAYSITHPIAQARGVKGVIISSITSKMGSVKGTLETTFACVELRKPLAVRPNSPGLSLASTGQDLGVRKPPSKTAPILPR